MKTTQYLFLIGLMFGLGITESSHAQLLRKLKQKMEDKVVDKIDREVDGIGNSGNESNTIENNEDLASDTLDESENEFALNEEGSEIEPGTSDISLWMKYDFVPGDQIIFWDDQSDDYVGDFPVKWDLLRGNAEIAQLGGEKVILLKNGHLDRTGIFPLLEDKSIYGKQASIEFDIFLGEGFWEASEDFVIRLWENPEFLQNYVKEGEKSLYAIEFASSNNELTLRYGDFGSSIPKDQISGLKGWHHIAISLDGRGMKVFFNESKMLNIPVLGVKPSDFNIVGNVKAGSFQALKNIKIATGNIKLQQRIVTDGRYVANGILFKTNEATIQPTSFGIIRQMAQVMEANPTWKFTVEGHTDNVGDEDHNLALSEARAKAVVDALMNYNIEVNRLTAVGKGEGFPLSDNNLPEGRANNRRVEFVLEK